MSKKLLVFGDAHIPNHDPEAVSILLKVARRIKPDVIVCLGDLLDLKQFSVHPPTLEDTLERGQDTQYERDIQYATKLLDDLQKTCGRLVMLEGNHEYRIDRWAAQSDAGRAAYSMLAPRLLLSRNRKLFTYVRYQPEGSMYPHYKINSRIIAVHGWSYAMNATHLHLQKSQGRSVVHGHTHRAESRMVQCVYATDRLIQAFSFGCMCRPVPTYNHGRVVEWIRAMGVGYLGRRSDSLYTVPIIGDRCILPDGTEVTA